MGSMPYIESDVISVLFPPVWDRFDRRLEKVVKRFTLRAPYHIR
jgi:hypothetical protein